MIKTFSPIRLNSWREIAILMIIIMDVSWITPWFRSLTPETYAVNSVRILIILSSIILLSYILIRCMDYLKTKEISAPKYHDRIPDYWLLYRY